MPMHASSQVALQEAAPVVVSPTTPKARRRLWHRATAPTACMGVSPSSSPAARVRTPRPAMCMHSTPAGVTCVAHEQSCSGQPHATQVDSKQVEFYRSAKSLQLAGREDDALRLLQAGLAQFPADRHMLALASSLMVKTSRLDDAAALLSAARAWHPQHLPFLTATALLEAKRGQHAAAVALLQTGLQRHPDNAVLLQTWAELEAAAGHLELARRLFTRAIQLRPGMPHSYAAWASLELTQGDVEQARKLFAQGNQAVPHHAPLLHAWAKMEQGLGCATAAKQLCEQALRIDPAHIPSYMLLGQLEWSQGSPSRAREVWKRGNSTPAGASAALLCFWAQRESRIYNFRGARGLLQAALAADPNHTQARVLLAMLHDRAGQSHVAAELYLQMVQTQHSNALDSQNAIDELASQRAVNGEGALHHMNGTAADQQGMGDSAMQHVQSSEAPQDVQQEAVPRDTVLQDPGSAMGVDATARPQPLADLTAGIDDRTPIPVLYAFYQHMQRQQQHLPQDQQEVQAALDQLITRMQARAPHNGYLCHLQGLKAQQEGQLSDAMACFHKGTRSSVNDGSLLCWEGLAELLAFLGKHDMARRAWRTGAARAARPSGWDSAAGVPAATPQVSTHATDSVPVIVSVHGTTNGTTNSMPATNGHLVAPAAEPVEQDLHQSHIEQQHSNGPGSLHEPAPSPSVPGCAASPQHVGGMASPAAAAATQGEHLGHMSGSAAALYNRPTLPSQSSPAAASQAPLADGLGGMPALAPGVANGEGLDSWMLVGVSSRYLRQWALFEKKAGGSAAAAQLFEAAASKDPQDYKTWLAWAMFERRRGQLQHAEQLFRQGLHVAPYNTHMWHVYANMLWRQRGDVNSARDTLRRATKHCPRSVHLRLEWALLEWRGAGDPQAAERLLVEALSLPGGQHHGPLQEAWTQLQKELGRPLMPFHHGQASDGAGPDGSSQVHGGATSLAVTAGA